MEKRAKVLLVDDDVDFVEINKTVLEKEYQVVVAYDGDEGLKKIVEENPDLIILDVVMPRKDGFAVCKELKESPRYKSFSKIPVILLTVFPHGMEKTRIPLSAGVDMEAEGYVQKPVKPQEMLKKARELLTK